MKKCSKCGSNYRSLARHRCNLKYECEKCEDLKPLDRKRKHCNKCKRKVIHAHVDPSTLGVLSTRTVAKLIKRARIACMTCGWNRTSLDLHHIQRKADGGSDADENLIVLCPNCHRMAHERQYERKHLEDRSVSVLFANGETSIIHRINGAMVKVAITPAWHAGISVSITDRSTSREHFFGART